VGDVNESIVWPPFLFLRSFAPSSCLSLWERFVARRCNGDSSAASISRSVHGRRRHHRHPGGGFGRCSTTGRSGSRRSAQSSFPEACPGYNGPCLPNMLGRLRREIRVHHHQSIQAGSYRCPVPLSPMRRATCALIELRKGCPGVQPEGITCVVRLAPRLWVETEAHRQNGQQVGERPEALTTRRLKRA